MNDCPEKVCTLSIDHAIRIAKIIATAPVARMPMITQLFHQASVDLEGLEELIEDRTGINTMTAEEPMTCVAIGTGKYVEFLSGKPMED